MRSAFLLSISLVLAACSSGAGNGASTTADTGQLSVVLTETPAEDLARFEVDVGGITLTKRNGNTVTVMPRRTRIDFVELDNVGELVAGLALEAGVYTTLTMDLDFGSAEVFIAGSSTKATIQDQNGRPLTGIEPVELEFAEGARPLVGARRHNLFVLDLDLAQSVAVDGSTNTVTFTPVLSAEVDPQNPRPVVGKGWLQSVDLDDLTFTLQRRAPDGSTLGEFVVQTGSGTVFQLDGRNGVGATAFGDLRGHIGQCVWVQGTMSRDSRALVAVAVESGHGVPGNGQDWVLGHVVARSGGAGQDATLTVLGRSRDVTTGTRHFNTAHTVEVSFTNTNVLRRGFGNTLDTDAINIGQRVWIFGDVSGTTLTASDQDGVARLLPTAIFGVANDAPANATIAVDLVRFGHRDVTEFDFEVSGQSQADPDDFTIDVTGLGTTGIGAGAKLRMLGWIEGVGSTGPNATAAAITNRTTTARVLFCQWLTPSTAAIASNPPNGRIELDVDQAFIRAVADGFGVVNLATTPAPSIQPLLPIGGYRIVQDRAIEHNVDFAVFRESLLARTATTPVLRVTALGTFDEGSQEFTALTVTVILD